jgi:glycosyltransferase involved in cell wall biosynthesis
MIAPSMRNVLMIAFHYPPEGGSSGVLRTLKFTKYLPEFGWRPTVITAVPSAYHSTDPSLLGEIPPQAVVVRASCVDAKRMLSFRNRYLSITTLPDRYLSWLPFAVRAALKQITRNRCEVIFSTCPIPTAHLAAGLCHRLTGLPWIADFRDPWVEDIQYSGYSRARHRIERAMEATVVKMCTLLTVTTDLLMQEFREKYPQLPLQKTEVLPNGFDEEDFQSLDDFPSHRNGVMEIVHSGHVNPGYRNPSGLIDAIGRLVRARDVPEDSIRLTFLGGGVYLKSTAFRSMVASSGLDRVVQVLDRVPYRDSLLRLHDAAVLLILQGGYDTRHLIPAKAFEYLRANRPILALTGDGVTARLVREFDAGDVVGIDDVDGICRSLHSMYDRFRQGILAVHVDRDHLREKYDRRNLTAALSRMLDRLAGVRP